jgi:hypothetical protein
MARIWRLGSEYNELLPNMLMIKVLVGVYLLFFIGQIMVSSRSLVFHLKASESVGIYTPDIQA